MEFHKKIDVRQKPKIITKKKIVPKVRIFASHSQSNIPTMKQFQSRNENLAKKKSNKDTSLIESVKRKINEKIDATRLIKNVPTSSLVINLRPKYQMQRPIKKYSAQVRNPNPMKQIEYQVQIQSLDSSQKSIQNSMQINAGSNNANTSKNNSKGKISNSSLGVSPLYINRSLKNLNNENNNNELEIEINPENEEKSQKIRYHRTRKFSPIFTYNTAEKEEIIYNVPMTDEDSISKNNFNPNNQYFDAYEINEGMDPVQIRVLNRKFKYNNKNDVLSGNPFLYSDEKNPKNLKYEEDNKNFNNNTQKFVRKYTDIYDPKKNSKGVLLQDNKVTVPLTDGSYYGGRIRVCSKNSKLSDILMTKKNSPEQMKFGYDDYFSGSEDKTTCHNEPKVRNLKTFNRRSFEKYTECKKIMKMYKSPEERFKNFSLAMISSKGKNTENRPISRKMRFEKGGVVDFSQDDRKKKKYKYFIKKMKRPIGKQLIHNNPKYREKAAELIQDWWFSIKEYRKKRIKAATLIQSYFKGRFVRKYLYDVIYMNYLYFGFCKKIEKFIRRKYGPYFFDCLFAKFIKQKLALKKLILNYELKILKIYIFLKMEFENKK